MSNSPFVNPSDTPFPRVIICPLALRFVRSFKVRSFLHLHVRLLIYSSVCINLLNDTLTQLHENLPSSWCFKRQAINILPTFSTGWSAGNSTGNIKRFCLQNRSTAARNFKAVPSSNLLEVRDCRKGLAGSLFDIWRVKGSCLSSEDSFSFLEEKGGLT